MKALTDPHSRWLTMCSGILLGLATSLLLWRYTGITHDSVLYLGQALVRRWPDIYGNDLVFMHGSGQERYTLFPVLINQTLNWFGPPLVFLWGTLVSLLAFTAASWYCLRALLPNSQRTWAWLGVICLPSAYGMVQMFSYREQFFTSRPIAEALCLIGIGLLARNRWLAAFATFVGAGLFHPLQTIAVVLVIWPWAIMQDRRWLHAAWLAIPVSILAFAQIAPFGGLFQQLDASWLSALNEATSQLFITSWSTRDFYVLGFDIFILVLAWRELGGTFAAWCAAALAGLALGFAASLVMVDALHLVLPAGLQLWRVHWLAHVFAMAAVAATLLRDFNSNEVARALLLGVTALLVWIFSHGAWIPLAMLYAAWPKVIANQKVRMKPLLGFLFGSALFMMLVYFIALELLAFRTAQNRFDLYDIDRRILAFPLVALGLPLAGHYVWGRLARKGRWALLICFLCPIAVLAATRWDARSPVNLAMERAAFRPNLFGVAIPENAQIYWGQYVLIGPWLTLQRASYFSPIQLAGEIFNRNLALDGSERIKRMLPMILEDLKCQERAMSPETRNQCRISDEAMLTTCGPGSNDGPDFLVLPYQQQQRALGTWAVMGSVDHAPAATYWLYSCAQVVEDLKPLRGSQSAGAKYQSQHQPIRAPSRLR